MPTLLVDTDCGFDDIFALTLLIKSDKFSAIALSPTSGMSNIGLGISILRRLFAKNNPVENISIIETKRKRSISLEEWGPQYRDSFRTTLVNSLDIKLDQNPKVHILGQKDTIEEMATFLLTMRPENNDTLLCLGPLTNIAALLRRNPTILSDHVSRVVVMGGAYSSEPGNHSSGAELNFYLDSEAAHFVLLHSGVPLELFGLETARELPPLDLLPQPSAPTTGIVSSGSGGSESDNFVACSNDLVKATVRSHSDLLRYLYRAWPASAGYDSLVAYHLLCSDAFELCEGRIAVNSEYGVTSAAQYFGGAVLHSSLKKDEVVVKIAQSTFNLQLYETFLKQQMAH